MPRKSHPDKDFQGGHAENISEQRLAEIRPQGLLAGQTQVSPQFRHEGPGYLRPLPSTSTTPASMNELDNSRPTIPKAKLNPAVPFVKGRFTGPKPNTDDTIREIPNESGDE